MSDNTEEILGKIEQAHMRGEHTLGMFAGCSLCLQVSDGRSMGVSGAAGTPLLEELARAAEQAGAAAAPGTVHHFPGANFEPVPSAGDSTLGDIALQDAQQALDDLDALGRAGIVVPNAQQAIAHALVGVVRALVAIEETAGRLVTLFEPTVPEPVVPDEPPEPPDVA